MQHHPGSWYIPWGVPLQKMLAVPAFNPAAAAAGYQPQIAAAAVQQAAAQAQQQQQQPQPPNQTQQSPYSHPHHPHHHPLQTMHHNHAAAIQMHPAAAAMFTPLTLRSFMAHPHLNLSQQPMPTASAQQQSQQPISSQTQSQLTALNLNNVGVVPVRQTTTSANTTGLILPMRKVSINIDDSTLSFFFVFFKILLKPLVYRCTTCIDRWLLYREN